MLYIYIFGTTYELLCIRMQILPKNLGSLPKDKSRLGSILFWDPYSCILGSLFLHFGIPICKNSHVEFQGIETSLSGFSHPPHPDHAELPYRV